VSEQLSNNCHGIHHEIRVQIIFDLGCCAERDDYGCVASATSATLNVTNDGADSASCGAQTKPCRTISQAIENAADGDSIEVGAGIYGNVSGDPNFAGPGDEHPQMELGCVVCITKGVNI
jgi:hypothetical protein